MPRTRIKICGITRIEDALLACELGADAIGIVMTPSSPRCVSIAQARAIRAALPPLVDAVVVVMDQMPSMIEEIVVTLRPDFLQFHGSETAEMCGSFRTPYIKAFGVGTDYEVEGADSEYHNAAAILLDGEDGGGGGKTFDWSFIPRHLKRRIFLAGGLTKNNVTSAIQIVRPYAIDVSSGVESAPGIKSEPMLKDLFAAVHFADSRCNDDNRRQGDEK